MLPRAPRRQQTRRGAIEGLRQRRLHKVLLRHREPKNWPLLREFLQVDKFNIPGGHQFDGARGCRLCIGSTAF